MAEHGAAEYQCVRILATKTVKETVGGALLEVMRAQARREAARALSTMEGMDLDKPDVMQGAWRQ